MVQNHKAILVLGLVVVNLGEAVSTARKHTMSANVGSDGDIDLSDVELASPARKHTVSAKVGADGDIKVFRGEQSSFVRNEGRHQPHPATEPELATIALKTTHRAESLEEKLGDADVFDEFEARILSDGTKVDVQLHQKSDYTREPVVEHSGALHSSTSTNIWHQSAVAFEIGTFAVNKTCSSFGGCGTYVPAIIDVTSFVNPSTNKLFADTLMMDVWCADTDSCPKLFEYCQINNDKGLQIQVPPPNGGWKAARWQQVQVPLMDSHYRSTAGPIQWDNMNRLELYSHGRNAHVSLRLKKVRFDTTTTTTHLPLADRYPCPPVASDYDVVVSQEGAQWNVSGIQAAFENVKDAIDQAFTRLDPTRNYKQSILVHGSGTLSQTSPNSASCRISIPSFTVLNVCGELHAECLPTGDRSSVIFGSGTTSSSLEHIDIPNMKITGTSAFAVRFQASHDIHIGRIYMNMASAAGAGIRLDAPSSRCASGDCYTTNVQIDEVIVSGLGGHGVETFNVDTMNLGSVVAENVGYCAVILNNSTNIEVGSIYSLGGQWRYHGYAALRMANQNGRMSDGTYPFNIHVREVISKEDHGRGLFCITGSGGAKIDYLSVEAGNDILLNNCRNMIVGSLDRRSTVNNTIIFAANSGESYSPPRVLRNTQHVQLQNLYSFTGDTPPLDLSRNCDLAAACPSGNDGKICGNTFIYNGAATGC